MALPSIIVGLAAAALAAAAQPPSTSTTVTDRKLGEGPVDFRCDSLSVSTKPNRNICRGNVVIRRGDMLICCQLFEGKADDAWVWESFTCSQDVRAQRGIETVWADKANFLQAEGDLVLTGKPVLHRGDSVLEGDKVVVNTHDERARVVKPRGRMVGDSAAGSGPGGYIQTSGEAGSPPPQKSGSPLSASPLPAVCPLPALKR